MATWIVAVIGMATFVVGFAIACWLYGAGQADLESEAWQLQQEVWHLEAESTQRGEAA